MNSKLLRCAVCNHEIEVVDHDASRVYRCQKCSGILLVPGVSTRRRVPAGTRFGRFQLINVLARGARATVYRALDTEKLRLVALKQFGGPEFSDAATVMEWVEGVRPVTGFDHASLVRVFDVGLEDGAAFLTMTLVEGAPLHRVAQTTGLALFPLLTALRDVAQAVGYLHGRGYSHGRIRADHVLLGDGGAAMLASVDGANPRGAAADDLQALGRMLYEAVVRQPADAAVRPHDLGIEMQKDLEYLVVRAARCEYPRAQDLAADIDRYLCGRPLVRDSLWRRWLGG
ncbi:MAG: protein kinase [Planctomycetes bacterium]|nr:protein kinase [Planctomycetota bacterium]